MNKYLLILLLVFIAIFALIQFFQPDKNRGEITSDHLFEQMNISEDIQVMLKNACLDCHSNQTTYLWYHQIAPVSWMINQHITDGKKELNLSEWGQWDMMGKLTSLDKMKEEVEKGTMPLKPYILMHPKAKLTEEQKKRFYDWIEKLSEEMLVKMTE